MRILKRLAGIAAAAAMTTGLVAGLAAPSNADSAHASPTQSFNLLDTGWDF